MGRGSAAGRNFLARPYYSQRAVFASPLSAFFIDGVTADLTTMDEQYSNAVTISQHVL